MMNALQTNSGQIVDLLDPQYHAILLKDIAHALGNTCRFAGHSKSFYSVAQHCCVCADNARNDDGTLNPVQAWGALLHDASEAYMCDIPTPLKRLLPDYRRIESHMQETIEMKFNVESGNWIKELDARALATEVRDVLAEHPGTYWANTSHIKPFDERIIPWSPEESRYRFVTKANAILYQLSIMESQNTNTTNLQRKIP